MFLKLYRFLVNRNYTVKRRYEQFVVMNHKLHKMRFISWAYLLWLNICFCLLRLPDKKHIKFENESGSGFSKTSDTLVNELCQSDVISFDMFDTLILRPVDTPADLFYFVGERLNIPNFRDIRKKAERTARKRHIAECGSGEVTLAQIYDVLAEELCISTEIGMLAESDVEISLCMTNPFMLEVWNKVKAQGKKIVVTTDMYLPKSVLEAMLQKCGFTGYDAIFLSNEYGYGKYNGKLYDKLKSAYPKCSISHVGDNYHADYVLAKKSKIHAVYYRNIQDYGKKYRTDRMSYIVGSAYRSLVNRRMFCMEKCSPAMEFGYKYGGLLLLGFCNFIHEQSALKKADKILFFSRDGHIVKELYDKLYPDEKTEYVYWSRAASAKLCVDIYPQNYFDRFLDQKSSKGIMLSEILDAMDLSELEVSFPLNQPLTSRNLNIVKSELYGKLKKITKLYEGAYEQADKYFEKMLSGCKRVVTVDCGWAGSGSILLDAYLNQKMKLDIEVTGLLAGSNSKNQHDSDYSETYFKTGKLISYCFSSEHNRECYETHFPGGRHNIYFELMFGAPQPSFIGFTKDGLKFDSESENSKIIREIHAGEIAFANDYLTVFQKFKYMNRISGSDAYAPFLAAISGRKKYLLSVFRNCVFDETVNGRKEKL